MKYPNLIEHFEMIMAHVQDESYAEAVATIATFKNRLIELEEKLSEFQNGIEIEKANKELTYYYETGGAWFQTKYIDGAWMAWDLYKNSNQPITEKWLYRFPSTETQMEGE